MHIGIADFGLNVWEGACYDSEQRWSRLKEIGYEGIERLTVASAEEAVNRAAGLRRMQMDFATIRCQSPELSIQWTAAFGKRYVWSFAGTEDFEALCRQVNTQAEICQKWGIHVALHNHMGTAVETQEQLESFLKRCPSSQLVFDTGHLAAVGGDVLEIVDKYADRFATIHVKDYFSTNPEEPAWHKRGYFCGLGKGNIGLDIPGMINLALQKGYDGWFFVEHDLHMRDPYADYAESREYLKRSGF